MKQYFDQCQKVTTTKNCVVPAEVSWEIGESRLSQWLNFVKVNDLFWRQSNRNRNV